MPCNFLSKVLDYLHHTHSWCNRITRKVPFEDSVLRVEGKGAEIVFCVLLF